jgi:hypothetical protein
MQSERRRSRRALHAEVTKCASKKSVFFSKIKNRNFCLFFRANLTVLGVLVGSVVRTLYSTTDLDFGSHRAHRVGGTKPYGCERMVPVYIFALDKRTQRLVDVARARGNDATPDTTPHHAASGVCGRDVARAAAAHRMAVPLRWRALAESFGTARCGNNENYAGLAQNARLGPAV